MSEVEFTDKTDTFIKSLKFVGDLFYYQGPIISLFEGKDSYYIFKWLDILNSNNIWLVYNVGVNDIRKYLYKAINEKVLQENSKSFLNHSYYKLDIDNNSNYKLIESLKREELEDYYFPEEGVYFDENYCEDYNKILKNVSLKSSLISRTVKKHKSGISNRYEDLPSVYFSNYSKFDRTQSILTGLTENEFKASNHDLIFSGDSSIIGKAVNRFNIKNKKHNFIYDPEL